MAKKRATSKDERAETAHKNGLGPDAELTKEELETAVVSLFCQGAPVSQISDIISEHHRMRISREAPWRILSEAARNGRFLYRAREEERLESRLGENYPWLEDRAVVVNTSVVEDVARRGAEQLLRLVRRHHQINQRVKAKSLKNPPSRSEVHIAFAGSRCMRMVAREFASLLTHASENLPDCIWFHALNAGFILEEPSFSPLHFFSVFRDNAIQVKTELVGMYAPGLVKASEVDRYLENSEIKQALEKAKQLDIVVTSAGVWQDEHSALRAYLDKDAREFLEQYRCIGDLMWHPLFPQSRKKIDPGFRALTLLKLEDLPPFIGGGGDVLLVLGPCGRCSQPKTQILERIMTNDDHLVTQVVVDSRTVKGLLENPSAENK